MMKSMTKRERLLLILFVAILLILGYSKFVLEPVNTKVARYNNDAEVQQELIDENKDKVAEVERMREVIKENAAMGDRSTPVFDSSAELGIELQQIFANSAKSYAFEFGNVIKKTDLVKRPVIMNFTAETYAQAVNILNALHDSKHINQIGDVALHVGVDNGRTEATINVIFFEGTGKKKEKKD